ncbi:MAG: PD-(D/E)XK motif protein [Bacilli bacterium]|nr:PD-(D/E)XK motif protein [Bacilli bacterium]
MMNDYFNSSIYCAWKERTTIKPNGYVRVNQSKDNIIWFFGYDEQGRNSFRFDIEYPISLLKDYSSKEILVSLKKSGTVSSIVFILNNPELTDVFATLFQYLVLKIPYSMSTSRIADKVFEEYSKWVKMFNKGKIGLDENEQRGLIGELQFIRDCVEKGYKIDEVIACWCGIDYEEVDFVFPEEWWEIKTRLASSSTIHISSVGQLDHANNGFLRVYSLSYYENGISLNDIYDIVYKLIEEQHNPDLLKTFEERLENFGYFRISTYDRRHYSIGDIRTFKVSNSFPKINRSVKTLHMKNVNYTLIVDSLEEWKI